MKIDCQFFDGGNQVGFRFEGSTRDVATRILLHPSNALHRDHMVIKLTVDAINKLLAENPYAR